MVEKLHDIAHRKTFIEVFRRVSGGKGKSTIGLKEFKTIAKSTTVLKKEDDSSLEKIFQDMDVDGNGSVSILEFHRIYTQMKRLKKPISLEPYPGTNV